MEDEATVACSNCQVNFPQSKIDLHEVYCIRNRRKCDRCSQFVDKNEQQEHEDEFHKIIKCKDCK